MPSISDHLPQRIVATGGVATWSRRTARAEGRRSLVTWQAGGEQAERQHLCVGFLRARREAEED
eukprot:759325-Hanusia_phi.AAC.2